MKLSKRIESIVSLTVEDFYNSGKSTNESKKSLISWLSDALLQDEGIEDAYTYEVNIKALEMLNSLDIVDFNYLNRLVFEQLMPSLDFETSFNGFDEVAL